MERYLRYVIPIAISILFLLSGCQTASYKTYEPPELNIESFPSYSAELDKLTPIESPNFYYIKVEGDKITVLGDDRPEEATHVLFEPSEFAKIQAVVDRAATYKEMIKSDEDLINKNIDMLNRYMSYMKMERELTRQYYFMWKDAQEAYSKERRDHTIDNLINRGTLVLTVIGGIAIAAL